MTFVLVPNQGEDLQINAWSWRSTLELLYALRAITEDEHECMAGHGVCVGMSGQTKRKFHGKISSGVGQPLKPERSTSHLNRRSKNMICFDVEIDGEKVSRAGIGDFGVLAATVTWAMHRRQLSTGTDRSRKVRVSVGGMTNTGNNVDEMVHWMNEELTVGNEIKIKIIESDKADEPIERTIEDSGPRCQFCQKKESEVSRLIYAPPNNYICNECVAVCNQMIAGQEAAAFDNNAV